MPEKYVPAYEGDEGKNKPVLTPEEQVEKNYEIAKREGVAINARKLQIESERKKKEENFPKKQKRNSKTGPDNQTKFDFPELICNARNFCF